MWTVVLLGCRPFVIPIFVAVQAIISVRIPQEIPQVSQPGDPLAWGWGKNRLIGFHRSWTSATIAASDVRCNQTTTTVVVVSSLRFPQIAESHGHARGDM